MEPWLAYGPQQPVVEWSVLSPAQRASGWSAVAACAGIADPRVAAAALRHGSRRTRLAYTLRFAAPVALCSVGLPVLGLLGLFGAPGVVQDVVVAGLAAVLVVGPRRLARRWQALATAGQLGLEARAAATGPAVEPPGLPVVVGAHSPAPARALALVALGAPLAVLALLTVNLTNGAPDRATNAVVVGYGFVVTAMSWRRLAGRLWALDATRATVLTAQGVHLAHLGVDLRWERVTGIDIRFPGASAGLRLDPMPDRVVVLRVADPGRYLTLARSARARWAMRAGLRDHGSPLTFVVGPTTTRLLPEVLPLLTAATGAPVRWYRPDAVPLPVSR